MNDPMSTRTKHLRRLLVLLVAALLIAPTLGGLFRPMTVHAANNQERDAANPTDSAQLWTCGMHPQVIQDKSGSCPICAMALSPIQAKPSVQGKTAEEDPERLWTCGMHPQVIQDKPGSCPICGMDLSPLEHKPSAAKAGSGQATASNRAAVTIDPVTVQNMGLRTAVARSQAMLRTLRAAGFVEEAEPGIHDVTLRVRGWITRLHANTEGMMVAKGDPLLELYSPDLLVACGELIAASKAAANSQSSSSPNAAQRLLRDAREKLLLFGVDSKTIDHIAQMDTAPHAVLFRAPQSGHVTHKEVVEGSAVDAGEHVLRIVDHSKLWVDAQLPESQLALISVGQPASISFNGHPDLDTEAAVIFLHPHLDMTARTGLARFEVSNPDMTLRPGMFATVKIALEVRPEALVIPRAAVIDSGTRQLVFLQEAEGHFEPRQVRLGVTDDQGGAEILEGLAEGDIVVTSGQFLLDAESRMREALAKFLAQRRSSKTEQTQGAPAHVH